MRILLVSDWFKPNVIGGAEISVENLARGFMGAGHQVAVASLRKSPVLVREEIDGILHFGLPLGGVGRSPLDAGRTNLDSLAWQLSSEHTSRVPSHLDEVLAEFKPDAVVTNNLAGLSTRIWKVAAARDVPLVHTLRDYYLLCPFGTMYRRSENCVSQCTSCTAVTLRRRYHSRFVPAVVGISRFILERHTDRGYFPRATSSVIRVPYEAPARPPAGNGKNGKTVIGFIGRLHPSKGVEALISAFSTLRSDELSLCIAGSPFRTEYGDVLRRLAAGDSRIRFAGFMKASEFYSAVDVVVVPSLWNEPLSRVPIEAMAHGKPFVTSDRGGIAELPRESGCGASANPGDVVAFARALEVACRESKNGSNGVDPVETARRLYAPATIAKQYAAVIEKLRCGSVA
ncbi:MAG TPA: glycosyltransferase family 4 protein [Polyangiaceae bacterium]|jgi:glycosyltransferase involved in cell wall biosynthesis|nr:glycosyltransferase family 4 protein [Polyangiaceae bacterium]